MELDTKGLRCRRSVLRVYNYLKRNGPAMTHEIASALNLSLRTVRYALKQLVDLGIVQKTPDITDPRRYIYYLTEEAERKLPQD